MSLQIKEIVGAIVAFIPFVSTFSGLIKAVIYYKKTNKNKPISIEMDNLAEKTYSFARMQLRPLKKECNKKLFRASVAEIIPGVNIISAIYALFVLNELSEIREILSDPEKHQAALRAKIFESNNLPPFPFKDEAKNQLLLKVVKRLDENEKHYIPFCYGVIEGGRFAAPDAIIEVARKDYEERKGSSGDTTDLREEMVNRIKGSFKTGNVEID